MADDLAHALSEALGAISEQLRLRFAATELDEPGLGFVALATLRHLVRHGPKSVTELAEADRVTTQAISSRVASLVDDGLVERRRDPADARRMILSATQKGMRTVTAAQDRGRAALAAALTDLSEGERGELRDALPTLNQLSATLRASS